MPASRGARKPPTLLEAVQKPQKVPRSLPANQAVRKRAHAGAPSPYTPIRSGHGFEDSFERGLGVSIKPDSHEPSTCGCLQPLLAAFAFAFACSLCYTMHSFRELSSHPTSHVIPNPFIHSSIYSSESYSQPTLQASQSYRTVRPQECHAMYTWTMCNLNVNYI